MVDNDEAHVSMLLAVVTSYSSYADSIELDKLSMNVDEASAPDVAVVR